MDVCLNCLKSFEPNANERTTKLSEDKHICDNCGKLENLVIEFNDYSKEYDNAITTVNLILKDYFDFVPLNKVIAITDALAEKGIINLNSPQNKNDILTKSTNIEIVKALRRLRCKTLNDYKSIDAAIDLINQLQAENERLTIVKNGYQELYRELKKETENLNEEICIQRKIIDERGSEVLRHDRCIRALHQKVETTKIESYEEFTEKSNNIIDGLLKTYSIADFGEFKTICQILRSLKNDINELLEEMKGTN